MVLRNDILKRTPQIGDIIAYNPPYYKGVEAFIIVGFSKSSGLPLCIRESELHSYSEDRESIKRFSTPKTGFVLTGLNIYNDV